MAELIDWLGGLASIRDDSTMLEDNETLLKKLFKNWTSKKKSLLSHTAPERIILRLDQAICPGGCHRLYWDDAEANHYIINNSFPLLEILRIVK